MSFEEKYNEKFKMFQNGEITLMEWQEFCTEFLEAILTYNRDLLKRMKEEW